MYNGFPATRARVRVGARRGEPTRMSHGIRGTAWCPRPRSKYGAGGRRASLQLEEMLMCAVRSSTLQHVTDRETASALAIAVQVAARCGSSTMTKRRGEYAIFLDSNTSDSIRSLSEIPARPALGGAPQGGHTTLQTRRGDDDTEAERTAVGVALPASPVTVCPGAVGSRPRASPGHARTSARRDDHRAHRWRSRRLARSLNQGQRNDGRWWTVLPSTADSYRTWLWQLRTGGVWVNLLRLSSSTRQGRRPSRR
jgi:hypothetical protein